MKSIGPGDPVALTTGEKGDFAPAWSPDGQFIAFMRPLDAGHSAVIIMASVGGQERHVTDLAFSAGALPYNHEWSIGSSPLTWSPNGKWLIGLDARGPTEPMRAVRISVGTREKRTITSGPQDFEGDGCIALSPDGKTLAFSRGDIYTIPISDDMLPLGELRRLTFEGKTKDGLAWTADGHVTTSSSNVKPSWSHDGNWIYFGSDRGGSHQIWKIPASGGKPIQLTRKGGMVAYESADGKSIYYALGFDLWEVPVDGGEEVKVLNSIYGWNFAPGKQGVYFLDGNEFAIDLKLLDLRTHRIQIIAAVPGAMEDVMTISPDEQSMAYAKAKYGGSELMLIENFH